MARGVRARRYTWSPLWPLPKGPAMRNPFQDQLLKAGLVKKHQLEQTTREQDRQRRAKKAAPPAAWNRGPFALSELHFTPLMIQWPNVSIGSATADEVLAGGG